MGYRTKGTHLVIIIQSGQSASIRVIGVEEFQQKKKRLNSPISLSDAFRSKSTNRNKRSSRRILKSISASSRIVFSNSNLYY